ncbi:MAG TPA: acyl-CoA desaturase, partial [Chitinophagaceae bacterium]|nr:acyl-CoA desaturase [Chitinophagaceae bacterium]
KENNLSKYGNTSMVIKTITLLLFYIVPFIIILTLQPSFGIALLLWTVMGFGLAGVGMSIMHDANHGAYSPNKNVNYIMGNVVLNLLGASAFNWKLQHNILHHTYTNITHMDEDIDDKLVLKFSPHTKVKPVHRFQWLYSFLFYGITTLYWVTAKDFIQFARYNRNGVNNNSKAKNRITLLQIITVKVVYMFVFLVVPTLFFGVPFGQVLVGFLLMHFLAGVILTVVFQLAHSVEGTSHPLPNEDGIIENDWAIHQLNTTVNFARHNKILSWYVGGLNFQVEHHLFPRISHIHYPKIAPIVKQTAEEFGIPYLENKTFGTAIKSHIQFLQRLGRLPDINEAIA